MAREKKKKIDIKLIIGILFMLVLFVGASYAYFAVGIESSEYNKTIVTGSTEGVSIASIQNPTEKLNLNVDAAAMSQNRLGTIYADDEENYVKTKSEGFHDIGVITLTNPKKDDNIYRCTANVTITVDNGVNSILPVLEKDDLKVFVRWGAHHEIIDLSELKNINGGTTIPISLDIVGNDSKSIEAYIEFTNRDEDQSYLSKKDINIDIDTTDLKCELTGERAVYIKNGSLDTIFGHTTDIKNIYFVNYIDTSNAVEDPIDLTRVGTGNLQSPAGSIIGWLEETPKGDEDDNLYYDLFIGSKDRIYAINCFSFSNLNNLETIELSNFYSDFLQGNYRCFYGSRDNPVVTKLNVSNLDTVNMTFGENYHLKITELDVSNFNTKNYTNMEFMFFGFRNVIKLDVSNFNTMKAIRMNNMFAWMYSLEELDVSGFYTGNVTSMEDMFNGLEKITKLDLSKFDTHNVTRMREMFTGMSSLTELDVSSFNTENVTTMENMFSNMTSLQRLDLSSFKSNKVINMARMFYNDNSLEYIDFRNAEFSQVTTYDGMFWGVKNGITIIVKDEKNREWIEARLKEVNKAGNVLLPNEIEEP